MKATNPLHDQLSELIDQFGNTAVETELKRLRGKNQSSEECTILINRGLHTFPDHLFRGDVYVVYEGSIDLSSSDTLQTFVRQRLLGLRDFLVSKKWRDINLIISGHAAICMQVKLAVYRITHVETTDWVFDGAGNYIPLQIPMRKLLASGGAAEA
jgi:hypothetical protein